MAPRRSARLTQNAENIRPTANGALVEQSHVQKEEDSNTTRVQSRKTPKRARKNIIEGVRTANRSKRVSDPKEPKEDEKKDDEIVEAEDMTITEDAKADSYSKNTSSGKKRKTSAEQEPRKPDPEEVVGALAKKKRTNKTSRVSTAKKDNAKVNKSIIKAERQEAQMEQEDTVSFFEDEAGRPDGNGGLDNGSTYIIEYSKTSRATCKRCDIRINKNELRVGHRPLFRGKPGYQVFKHLHCIVFSEEIACAEDVAGYDGLTDDDYKALAKRVDESFKLIQKENEELEPDELVQKKFEGEMRGAPKGLAANLLPFQQEGVSWMYHQERNIEDVRGGILADEMGMGKTLQTIATILDNRPKLQRSVPGGKYPACAEEERKMIDNEESLWKQSLKDWKHEMAMNDVHKSILPKSNKKGEPEGGARAGTLVVCPVIALSQWKSEIDKFCEDGALSVAIYHGPDRVKTLPRALLTKYDVVLTTYQVLEADFRKMVSPNKVKCPNCGARFKVDKLRVHLKYFCGEGAQRTEAQARTIRNSERGHPSNNSRANPSGRGNNQTGSAKKGKKTFAKKKVPLSESDDEIENSVAVVKKSPRGAATKARTKMKTMRVSSRDKYESSNSDEDYSEESEPESASDASSSDDDDVALKRAREKQARVMKRAATGKKTFAEEKEKKNVLNSKKKKKKFDDESSASSSEEDIHTQDVDMDALVAEAMAGATMSILHSVCWWRIVLDEAHMIKSRSSQTSHAAFALTGIHRWALSGTPLQNRVGEFYSLIRFLRLDPMAHYFCRAKDCNCKQIHYRMWHGKCKDCGHGSIQHYSYFNKHILNPIQRDGYSHDGRRAMFVLKSEVLDKCLLRRTKETRAEDMNLPPRIVTIKSVRLHPVEEDFYNALYTQTASQFNDYVAGGTLLNNYAHIFDLLMRMRQSVAHPYLVVYSKKGNQAGIAPGVTNGRADCHLCDEPPTERVVSTCCQTAFCRSCVLEYMETAVGGDDGGSVCPHCSRPFTVDLNNIEDDTVDDSVLTINPKQSISTVGLPSLKELSHVATGSILRRIDLTKFATSTKIEALTQELINMRKQSPGSKAIVFSQFVNMLDLIRWRLHSDPFLSEIGLGARALHGGMDVKSRDEALKDFRDNPNVRVLLMSLKAGGVALNLTVANYIYLVDPWWNPAAELQAIDRTHRLGQYRPIRAVRFIAENTVEERILQLQEKKRLVFDGTVGRDAGSLKMLTVDDMKSLFA